MGLVTHFCNAPHPIFPHLALTMLHVGCLSDAHLSTRHGPVLISLRLASRSVHSQPLTSPMHKRSHGQLRRRYTALITHGSQRALILGHMLWWSSRNLESIFTTHRTHQELYAWEQFLKIINFRDASEIPSFRRILTPDFSARSPIGYRTPSQMQL